MAFPYNARSSGGYNRNTSNSNLSCTVGPSTPANNCECVDKRCDTDLHMVLAMAYVLPQCFKGINDSFDSFKNGYIFPELIKPFTGKGGCR